MSTPALHTSGRHVLDAAGNIVILRGYNYSFYLDWVAGNWTAIGHNVYDDSNLWSEANLRVNLAEMQRQHVNVLRVTISAARWYNNQSSGGVTHQQILMNLIRIAQEYGIYIAIAPWSAGAGQGMSPWYPVNDYIKDEATFAAFWTDIANKINADAQAHGQATYPNVIYDLWNEPNQDGTTQARWFGAATLVINTLRNAGDEHVICVAWGYNGGVSFINTWLTEARPTYNILFTQHLYRRHGSFDPIINQTGDLNTLRNYITNNLNWGTAVNTWNVPLWCGETGAASGQTDSAEYACLVNEFIILNELQIGFSLWEYGREASYEWANFATNGPYIPPLNRVGQAVMDAILPVTPTKGSLEINSSPVSEKQVIIRKL